MIVTARARWLVILVVMTSIIALWQQYAFLLQLSIATLLWIGFEWITFHYRVDSIFSRLDAHRTLNSPQGPVRTLWESRPVGVETRLTLARPLLAFLRPVLSPLQAHVQDVLPTSVEQLDGASGRTVSLGDVTEFSLSYRIRPLTSGAVNFFGLRCVVQDLHGLFHAEHFVVARQEFRALPMGLDAGTVAAIRKRSNRLPPPGIHSLSTPGVGSELLEIRDYVPGDAPRSIAWKVTARRDELMTKQFESEVPVRCQLFVDMSRSIRLGYPGVCTGSRLVSLASILASSLASHRDPVGLSIFDGERVDIVRSSASRKAIIRMIDTLSRALDRPLKPVNVPSRQVIRPAFDIARIVDPTAMHAAEHFLSSLWPSSSWRMRLRMAAVLCNHYGLDELSMGELVDDDRMLSKWLQQYCIDHGSPWMSQLFDADGNYLFEDKGKVEQIAQLIRRAATRGRDSELFVLMAELTDSDYDLRPLVQAIKFAKARHHRVVVLLAWPSRMPVPDSVLSLDRVLREPSGTTEYLVERRQKESAFQRLRTEFGKLGVPVAVAADDQAATLILSQLEIVRSARALA